MKDLVTESMFRAKLSDVHFLMSGEPMDIGGESDTERVTLELNLDAEHVGYEPPRLIRAGHVAMSCLVMREDEEVAHATVCGSIPGKIGGLLRTGIKPDTSSTDPSIWLFMESWPPDYYENLRIFAADYLSDELM